jgi:hypothetical protein
MFPALDFIHTVTQFKKKLKIGTLTFVGEGEGLEEIFQLSKKKKRLFIGY